MLPNGERKQTKLPPGKLAANLPRKRNLPNRKEEEVRKKPGESARAFVSAGGVGKVSLVRQYTDMLRIPSPADVDATTFFGNNL